ncbi:response regulator [Aquincola sp. MAHUQ-54]|uniref:Response regulator n=1 Tax=Aquincola agrisoli TaxID=3119538 RepID=A0AAW9Q286_9BURK
MSPLQIFYVEDNDDLRETIGLLLEADDRVVTSFATAEEALEAFERAPCDVVVTDVSLPTMSGVDLARAVLAHQPGTWVVLSSGYAITRGIETLGPTVRSLPKPFEIEEMDTLLAEIAGAIAQRRA